MILKPIKIKKLEIHLLTFMLFAVGLAFDFWKILLVSYAVTAVHEIAHIIVARACGLKIKAVEILPFGITMRLWESCIKNTGDEIKIALAGPICNLVVAYFTYGFYSGDFREYIIASSLAMGIFNLLPALPLDGGRILRAVAVKKYGFIRAVSFASRTTFVVTVLVAIFGLYLLYSTGFNFSLLLICIFLCVNLTEERKNATAVIMKDILYSRKKLEDNGISHCQVLAVHRNEKAKKVLKMLSYDKYFIINIVDNHMNVTDTITETKLIEAIAVYGTDISIKKIVKM